MNKTIKSNQKNQEINHYTNEITNIIDNKFLILFICTRIKSFIY